MTDRQDNPDLSIVIDMADSFETCREAVRHWAAQTVADRIELVLIGPSAERMQVDEAALVPFHSVRIVELGEIRITGHATAAGIRAASAPYVAYGEQHSYAEPHLAETVIRALDQGYVAVGWALKIANPGLVGWAHLYLQFAPGVAPVPPGETDRLIGHHTAYRRDVLMALGDRLEDVMCMEIVFHLDLTARGERLYLCGEVASRHVQISDMRVLLHQELTMQRVFACTRVEIMGWGWGKRLLYAAAFPLIPVLRVRRALKALARAPERRRRLMPRVALVMFAAASAGAIGEATGYLFGGKRRALERAMPWELDRYAYLGATDAARPRDAAPAPPVTSPARPSG